MSMQQASRRDVVQVFDFNESPIRSVMRGDEPWFIARDVCAALVIKNARQAVSRLGDDEKGVTNNDTLGGEQKLTIVSEPGVFRLIFTSRSAKAEAFKRWLAHDVLPALRRTGSYAMARPADDALPAVGDDKAWGLRVDRVNAVARMLGVVARIYGPEAARALYEAEPGLPDLRGKSIGELTGTPGDDSAGCLAHLLRLATQQGKSIKCRVSAGFDCSATAELVWRDYGVLALPRAEGGPAIAVAQRHAFLARGFAETQWCGDWSAALEGLPGARVERKMKAVVVPFPRNSLGFQH